MFTISDTSNEKIIKFETDRILTQGRFEFTKDDDSSNTPLASQLLQLPFITKVLISANFIALQKIDIINWVEVQDELKIIIEDYFKQNNPLFKTDKQMPVEVYAESTPNPDVMKFVTNKLIVKGDVEFKSAAESENHPFIKSLFEFNYIKSVFVEQNYVSITKDQNSDWQGITHEIRNHIKFNIEELNITIQEQNDIVDQKDLDEISKEIIAILDEYIKPAVMADGGNIIFDSYNAKNKTVKVILKGACSGCPSSTVTLKNGIENTLKNLIPNKINSVIAI